MAAAALLFIAVLCSLEVQGSKAVTSVFVQTGHELNLDVTEADVPETITFFIWRFGTSQLVVTLSPDGKPRVTKNYAGRVEAFEKKYSVKLKNVQKADSGLYTARMTTEDEDKELTQYNVTVQDPVSSVDLEVIPNNSSSVCNLTVTCKTKDSHISKTFTCDNKSCTPEKHTSPKPSTSSSSFVVYLKEGYIICNHSNQVSSEQTKRDFTSYCPTKPVVSMAVMIGLSIVTALAVTILAMIVFTCKRKKCPGPEGSQEVHPEQNLYENPHGTSDPSPTTTYAMVQFPNRSVQEEGTNKPPQPETIYAQVNRPAKSNLN